MSNLLSENEQRVIAMLGDAWNAFMELPYQHPQERGEFLAAIHAAQHIVMARPVYRGPQMTATQTDNNRRLGTKKTKIIGPQKD